MDANEQPTPEQARASLEQITASRTAAAQATRRPAWIDMGMSTTAGATVGLGTAGTGWPRSPSWPSARPCSRRPCTGSPAA